MIGFNEFKLNQLFEDGIFLVKFSFNIFQFLFVFFWDMFVCFYDVLVNFMWFKYQYIGVVLDCVFYDLMYVWSGGLDY